MKEFGTKEFDKEYRTRVCVYVILLSADWSELGLVVTKEDQEYFLPGGGLEDGETHLECIQREMAEEAGYAVKNIQFLTSAKRFFLSTKPKTEYMLSEAHFYMAEIDKYIGNPTETEEYFTWLPLNYKDKLWHEHQTWAVDQAIIKTRAILG